MTITMTVEAQVRLGAGGERLERILANVARPWWTLQPTTPAAPVVRPEPGAARRPLEELLGEVICPSWERERLAREWWRLEPVADGAR